MTYSLVPANGTLIFDFHHTNTNTQGKPNVLINGYAHEYT